MSAARWAGDSGMPGQECFFQITNARGLRARMRSDELTTNLHAVRGISPRYASPEAFARLKLRHSTNTLEDDKMSDVYSVGVVVWELVTRMVRTPEINYRRADSALAVTMLIDRCVPTPRLGSCSLHTGRSRGRGKATSRWSKTFASACACQSWYVRANGRRAVVMGRGSIVAWAGRLGRLHFMEFTLTRACAVRLIPAGGGRR